MKKTPQSPKAPTPPAPVRKSGPVPLDPALLRHVAGGTNVPTPGPKGTW